MTDQMIDTTETPEIRTLARMRIDAQDYDERGVQQLTKPLSDARRRADGLISNFDAGSDGYRAAVDQVVPELDTAERDVLSKLESARRRVTSDLKALEGTGYRPALAPNDLAAAEAKASHLRSQLPHVDAFQAHEMLKGAVLHNDATELAAWALVGHELSNRFPASQMVQDARGNRMSAGSLFRDLLRQCEAQTGDRDVEKTRGVLTEALQQLDQQIGTLTQARNAHEPGNFGSILAGYQFGARATQEQMQRQRRYDAEAVNARLGKRSA